MLIYTLADAALQVRDEGLPHEVCADASSLWHTHHSVLQQLHSLLRFRFASPKLLRFPSSFIPLGLLD